MTCEKSFWKIGEGVTNSRAVVKNATAGGTVKSQMFLSLSKNKSLQPPKSLPLHSLPRLQSLHFVSWSD
jgi:hypothetical protein